MGAQSSSRRASAAPKAVLVTAPLPGPPNLIPTYVREQFHCTSPKKLNSSEPELQLQPRDPQAQPSREQSPCCEPELPNVHGSEAGGCSMLPGQPRGRRAQPRPHCKHWKHQLHLYTAHDDKLSSLKSSRRGSFGAGPGNPSSQRVAEGTVPSLRSVLAALQDSSRARRAETTTLCSAASLWRGTRASFRCHLPPSATKPSHNAAFLHTFVVQSRGLRPTGF